MILNACSEPSGTKRLFNLADGQHANPAKRYKYSVTGRSLPNFSHLVGTMYVPTEDLRKARPLPNSLEDWESTFSKGPTTSRPLYE